MVEEKECKLKVISLKFESDQYKLLEHCAHLMQAIHVSPKPVITQVHGIAYAAGCQLVASSDLAFSTEDARFATPGVNIGLFCSIIEFIKLLRV